MVEKLSKMASRTKSCSISATLSTIIQTYIFPTSHQSCPPTDISPLKMDLVSEATPVPFCFQIYSQDQKSSHLQCSQNQSTTVWHIRILHPHRLQYLFWSANRVLKSSDSPSTCVLLIASRFETNSLCRMSSKSCKNWLAHVSRPHSTLFMDIGKYLFTITPTIHSRSSHWM